MSKPVAASLTFMGTTALSGPSREPSHWSNHPALKWCSIRFLSAALPLPPEVFGPILQQHSACPSDLDLSFGSRETPTAWGLT